ncbi:MAG: TonB-dependent receptor [Candidatus Pseudobacter hemicellulosilyticus]|uniref:TonB-dependent receptor n=1 Tax=Candidatus Pseudobacter hemicellulosilyticus TaxID=3121375 RepID=A0AAJ5WRW0_9BACT|nr:MAG: TonB-dependent receptor [Pseudobacter sp.]
MKKMIACACLLACLCLSLTTWARQVPLQVTGKVNDVLGNPIPGVSITIKNAGKGTTSDENGNYTLSAVQGQVIVFNHIGMAAQEFAADKVPTIVVLIEVITDLTDVVVVGYGTQKKSVTTGAIARVKGTDLANMPLNRVEDALQGRAAGVTIAANNGQPGSAAAVRIRGITTLNNNNPLWVVDNVVVDNGGIGYLNQSDIESIEVLKDAASQAIYGARAASGVILITTKKGKAGKIAVNYNGFYGVSEPAKKLDMLDATQYATLRNEAAVNDGKAAPFADPAAFGKGTDWQSLIFNNAAHRQNHELSVSGGSERSTFYLSFGFLDQEGIVATDISRYKRMNLRINSTHKIASWLTVGQNVGYAHDKTVGLGNTNSEFGGPLSAAINLDPITQAVITDPAQYYSGVYANKGIRRDALGRPYGISTIVVQEMTNPLAYIQTRLGNYSWGDNIVGNVYLEATPIKGLKLRSNLGTKVGFWGNETFTPIFWLNATNISNITGFNRTNNRRFDWNLENTLSYTRAIGEHNATILLGQGAYKDNNTTMTSTTFQDIPATSFEEASLNFKVPTALRSTDGSEGNLHTVSSLFARLNYEFAEKYLVQALVRRDGSSRFGSNNRYGVFPSFNVGWVATKETFFPVGKAVNFLKIRGGYGVVGNDNIDDFAFLSTIGSGRNYAIGNSGSYFIGYSPNSPSNPDLKWEQTSQSNIGFDAVLFNDFNLTMDFFIKETKDILQKPRIPDYIGAISNPAANVGTVRNKGVEIELGYRKQLGDLQLSVSGNAAFMENEVTFLGNGIKFVSDGSAGFHTSTFPLTRSQVGLPVQAFYGFKVLGVFQNQQEIDNHVNKDGVVIQPDAKPGDFIWKDVDGNGVIDADDREYIGNPTPKWTYGFTLNLAYKGFDLTVFGQGAAGNKVYQALRRLDIITANWQTNALGRWTGEGTSTHFPRLTDADPNENFTKPSSFFLEDGGYFRMRTVQLGYTLPGTLTQKAGVSRLRIYLMAQNLFTITDYSGFDPEIGGNILSVDRGVYPQARSYMVGVNLGF